MCTCRLAIAMLYQPNTSIICIGTLVCLMGVATTE